MYQFLERGDDFLPDNWRYFFTTPNRLENVCGVRRAVAGVRRQEVDALFASVSAKMRRCGFGMFFFCVFIFGKSSPEGFALTCLRSKC